MSVEYTHILVTIKPKTGETPRNGFVDNNTSRMYIDVNNDVEENWPETVELALAKSRAYLRWMNILDRITTTISPIDVRVVTNDATANTEATNFQFVMVTDRINSIVIEDEKNPGTFLTGADALGRFTAMALVDSFTKNTDVLIPTNVADSMGSDTPKAQYGDSTRIIDVGPVADNLDDAIGLVSSTIIQNT